MTEYTNVLNVGQMKQLGVFETIPYQYIKRCIHNDRQWIVVELEDIPCEKEKYRNVKFKFEIIQGDISKYYFKEFEIVVEYGVNSKIDLCLKKLTKDYINGNK